MSNSLSNNLYGNKIYGNKLLVVNSQEKFVITYNVRDRVSDFNEVKDTHVQISTQIVDISSNYHMTWDIKRFKNPMITVANLNITTNDNSSMCNLVHTSLRNEQKLETTGQIGQFKYLITASDGIFSNYKYMLLKIIEGTEERICTFY